MTWINFSINWKIAIPLLLITGMEQISLIVINFSREMELLSTHHGWF